MKYPVLSLLCLSSLVFADETEVQPKEDTFQVRHFLAQLDELKQQVGHIEQKNEKISSDTHSFYSYLEKQQKELENRLVKISSSLEKSDSELGNEIASLQDLNKSLHIKLQELAKKDIELTSLLDKTRNAIAESEKTHIQDTAKMRALSARVDNMIQQVEELQRRVNK